MKTWRTKQIVRCELALLGLVVLLTWAGLRIPCQSDFESDAQLAMMCLAVILGGAWFFLCVHGMKRCLFRVKYADLSQRPASDTVMCILGVCLGVLAIVALAGGGLLLTMMRG
jgi:hypothetical protein